MSTALWTDSRFYGAELLQVADTVAREKGLEREKVLESMEDAIQKVALSKYGAEHDIRVTIDRKTGAVNIFKCMTVKEIVEDEHVQISLEDARRDNPDIQVDQVVTTQLPPIGLGRVSAQIGRQVIVRKIREAEREKQYEEFKGRVGEIVSGVVKRAEANSVTLDVGRTEAIIRREQLIPKENFRVGERVRAYIVSVSREERGAQVFLSRTHPQFLAKLFTQEVPEIYDGIVEIKAVARDPGSRAKIAVYTADPHIDPIGACVGVRGARVQAVTQELRGEKIDIVPWSEDPATFAVNALAPAEVSRVIMDEENRKFEVLAADNQLSLAIGRRGQNVRLASQLIGWGVTVVSESEALERRSKEYHARSAEFMEALDCDEVISHLLVAEGFASVDELAESSVDELTSIEGFTNELAEELLSRARAYQKKKSDEFAEYLKSCNVDPGLVSLGLDESVMQQLVKNKIVTLDGLADLATDELMDMIPSLSEERANEIIMGAREHWFK